LIYDLSTRDKYNDPGKLVQRKTKRGKIVFIKDGNFVFYQNNIGATSSGNFPYLAKFNLATKEKNILFRSQEDHVFR